MQRSNTAAMRALLAKGKFIYIPSAYDPIGGRLIESLGFPAAYVGGFVTGGSRCTSEPLLTMDEQVRVAGDVARALKVPLFADGGAGFGEPLHTMRSVREFIYAGVAGIHIEDQLYPKRAHYHKYVAHVIPRDEFQAKIDFACRARAETDPDFVIIARSDAGRFEGLEEAIARVNLAADVGADMGLVFPRNDEEMRQAPKLSKIPLVYVMSRGNRDGRPLPTVAQLEDMGYKACIDAVTSLLAAFAAMRRAYKEVYDTGNLTAMSAQDCIDARQQIEDLVGLEEFYEVEEQTVEKKKWGKR
jgi:2-methylisocitrate lyase-like PEP mutase family enzyme